MSKPYKEGKSIKWKWGSGWGHGKIKKTYTQKLTLSLQGTEVTRDASDDNPAYLIEQSDGDEVLKSHSELHQA